MATATVSNNTTRRKRSAPSRIAEILRAGLLDSGECKPGDQLPSIRELEDRYGFPRASLVQALSLLERDGCIDRRQGIGSFVTMTTSRPAASVVKFVALVSNSARNAAHILVDLCDGIEEATRNLDRHFVMATASTVDEEEREVDRLIASGCTSIILNPVTRTLAEMKTDYLKRKHLDVPLVLVDMAYPEQARTQVVFDNYQAGYDVTQALIDQGRKRIVFVRIVAEEGVLMHYSNQERCRGYCDAMARAGLMPAYWNELRCTDPLPLTEHLRPFMQGAFKEDRSALALIAKSDSESTILMALAREMGLRVPEDVIVAGFDNEPPSSELNRPFVTTNPDFRSAGRLAVRLATRDDAPQGTVYVLPAPVLGKAEPPRR
ncbi:MAG: GntR family transcriptional regulator [Capsulimonadaceae bacterium]|nr:GntR family transcriptional regulator [Capsulimonadaceae bacterium]